MNTPTFPNDFRHEVVELAYDGRTMTVDWYSGPKAGEASTARVIDVLLSDAASADQPFEDWAGDYGYDTDSRNAYVTWEAVREQTDRLRDLLGADFEQILGAYDPNGRDTYGVTSDLD